MNGDRRSLSDLARDLEEFDHGGDDPVSFTEYYVFFNYCSVVHGGLAAGPTVAEFFGSDRPGLPDVDYWKRMIRIWDGDDEPPLDAEELRARIDDHRRRRGESYPAPEERP